METGFQYQQWKRYAKTWVPFPPLPSTTPLNIIYCSDNFSYYYAHYYGGTMIQNGTQEVESGICDEDQAECLDYQIYVFTYVTL